ncbi:restriction endonuclease subunit S [Pseudoalteromonas lipolytica]|uniref:Type I restriction enzyme, S subunit n=1 Tax=Pseudoalteromonas lipolytica TaxID=570156 RepID=A0ABY1GQ48_9GAMM|nr:restriction endonuclease subunit S [Pseudoalteromonas lipolytica]MBE0349843.1 type I restriction enzyme, S subunit [Pseudoalteromonas lipolytica LMEB 39]SFU00733.1 type I restriction enzyme, S subunit [Pseudoalteromonas lipolytica]
MVPNKEIKKLTDLTSLITKGSTPTTYGYQFVDESKGEATFIGAYNCSFDGVAKMDTKKWITSEANEMLKRSKLAYEDSVLCIVGNTIGSSFMVEQSILPANINQNVALIRPVKEKVFPPYLKYAIRSPFVQWQVIQEASTQAQPSLSLKQVGDFKIFSPPLPEQRKIAKILSTWDKAISTTERLIDNSKQQKKALMQQLLTGAHTQRKRLLDDSGKPFEGEWEEKRLSELGDISSGGTPSTKQPEYWDGDINWVTPTDITKQDSIYIESTARLVSLDGIKNSSAKLLPKGTLLVCTRATIGEMAIASHEMSTNQGFKNIVPNENTNIEFVYYLLNFYKHKLISKASGSTFLELSKSAFEGLHFHIPKFQEQQKISAVLLNADQETVLLEQQLADLKQEKKALMQQLLTGKRRVKVDDEAVA